MDPWSHPSDSSDGREAGLRFGERGTHTSRTMMLAELTELLRVTPEGSCRQDYYDAIVEGNVLHKPTESTCRVTCQRLGELYGLDPSIPIFRKLRELWAADEAGRPLIALLCALARDPLLRATAPAILELPEDAELSRRPLHLALRELAGPRFNEAILDKVARNAASSWAQAGHLEGRMRKTRRLVDSTPGAVAMAIWIGAADHLPTDHLLESRWAAVLDRPAEELLPLALKAHRRGLLGPDADRIAEALQRHESRSRRRRSRNLRARQTEAYAAAPAPPLDPLPDLPLASVTRQGPQPPADQLTAHDVSAVLRTVNRQLRLLYPDPQMPIEEEDLSSMVRLALESRRRVKTLRQREDQPTTGYDPDPRLDHRH